jgi:hypothetical protein
MQTLNFIKKKIVPQEQIPYLIHYFALLDKKVKVVANFPYPYTFSDVEKLIALKQDFNELALLLPSNTTDEIQNLFATLYPVDHVFVAQAEDFLNYELQGLSLVKFQ